MASVYLAEDERLPRKAVVKIPKAAQFNAEFAERFTREAFWHAKVENLHVVHILDRGDEAGTPFLVLQYLPGGNLKAWCERNPSILDDPRLHYESWLLPVALALDAVAAQGIVHRDVKPSNILFDAGGQAYLSDFGIVKAGNDATMTGTGMFIGTLQFMSPEQCQPEGKRSLDGRSDQFGLAVTVYQVLTGWRYPVEDDTAVVYAAKFGHVAMTPPRLHDRRVPPAVDSAVMRALSVDREKRFASSGEFAKAILEASGDARGARLPSTVVPAAAQAATVATSALSVDGRVGTPPAEIGPGSRRTPAIPSRGWRWFRGLPDLALATAGTRLFLGFVTTVQLWRVIRTLGSVKRTFEDGEPYWLPLEGVASLANLVVLLAIMPCTVVAGWGGRLGRIVAAAMLGLFAVAHMGLAIRGISPGVEPGDAEQFGLVGGSALAWAVVAGVAGAWLLVVVTPSRDAAGGNRQTLAGHVARGLIATPAVWWLCDCCDAYARLPMMEWIALQSVLSTAIIAPVVALLVGFKARSAAVIMLFASVVLFTGPFDVSAYHMPLFLGWMCGLVLIVTGGPGPGAFGRAAVAWVPPTPGGGPSNAGP